VVESGLDDMGLDGALGVGEAVRANPNTTKRSKKKIYNTYSDSLPKIFTKTTQIKTKIKKSSLKNYTFMSLTREVK
jgi:hypothetical protein